MLWYLAGVEMSCRTKLGTCQCVKHGQVELAAAMKRRAGRMEQSSRVDNGDKHSWAKVGELMDICAHIVARHGASQGP
jgi:hypothetical protein